MAALSLERMSTHSVLVTCFTASMRKPSRLNCSMSQTACSASLSSTAGFVEFRSGRYGSNQQSARFHVCVVDVSHRFWLPQSLTPLLYGMLNHARSAWCANERGAICAFCPLGGLESAKTWLTTRSVRTRIPCWCAAFTRATRSAATPKCGSMGLVTPLPAKRASFSEPYVHPLAMGKYEWYPDRQWPTFAPAPISHSLVPRTGELSQSVLTPIA